MGKFRKTVKISIGVCILLFLLMAFSFIGLGWYGTEKMLRPPTIATEAAHQNFFENPTSHGVSIKKMQVSAADGVKLSLCVMEPLQDLANSVKGQHLRQLVMERSNAELLPSGKIRGTIILSHGLRGRLEHNLTVAERLTSLGFRCVLYDARAHGESEGEFCTYGFLERGDLVAIVDHLSTQYKDLGPIGLFGVSMGAAVSLQSLPLDSRFSCAVCVSPFASLSDTTWRLGEREFGSFIYAAYPATDIVLGMRCGFRLMEVAPVAAAASATQPVMLVHGTDDNITPYSDSERIFSALHNRSKVLRQVKGGDHHAVLLQGGETLYAEIGEFFLNHMWRVVPSTLVRDRQK